MVGFFVLFFNFYWSIVDWQCCVHFRCIAKWVSMKWSCKKTLCPFGCLSFGSFACVLTSRHQPVPTPRPQLCVYKPSLSSPPPSWGPEPVCLWWRKYPGLLNLALTLFFFYHTAACGILVPCPGIEPKPPALVVGLTTEPSGKSHCSNSSIPEDSLSIMI